LPCQYPALVELDIFGKVTSKSADAGQLSGPEHCFNSLRTLFLLATLSSAETMFSMLCAILRILVGVGMCSGWKALSARKATRRSCWAWKCWLKDKVDKTVKVSRHLDIRKASAVDFSQQKWVSKIEKRCKLILIATDTVSSHHIDLVTWNQMS
jgi:hypothetical protein